MRRHELSDDEWEVVAAILQERKYANWGRPSTRGDRNFVNGVIWIAKTGAPWRDLPERFGNWKTLYNRFSRWAEKGVWEALFKALSYSDDDLGVLMDSTIVRAHQDASGGPGGPKKTK